MKPWQSSLYGGMSEASARKSYEAWIAQGSKPLPVLVRAEPDEEIALRKTQIEIMMMEYRDALSAAIYWFRSWKQSRPKGFRAVREKQFEAA